MVVVAAVQREPKDTNGNILFDVKELEWFCQNAYNLGLKHASEWNLRSIVQVLTACSALISRFPDDVGAEQASDLNLRSIFCNFLISSALVALARAEDNLEQQLQDYLVARKHIDQADQGIQLQLQSQNIDRASSTDLLAKLAHLLAFDFEAAMALKKYQDLSEIVLKAEPCQNLDTYKTMADCALRGNLHPEGLPLEAFYSGAILTGIQSFSVSSATSSTKFPTLTTLTLRTSPSTLDASSKSYSQPTKSFAAGSWMRLATWPGMRVA